MLQLIRPTITAVHLLTHPAPLSRSGEPRAQQISLGLSFDTIGTVWGAALLAPSGWSADALRQRLSSLFLGHPFADPLSLIEALETELERPESLHPAIGYGMSLAILAAEARLQHRTRAETIASLYHLSPLQPDAIPLLAEVPDFAATAMLFDEMILDQPAAIGYRFTGGQFAEAMGQRGEILQRFVRELQQRITALGVEGYHPAIYVALQGGYGQLAAASGPVKSGAILAFLSGLEQAARPFPLLVEDPVELETIEAHIELMAQLRNFVQLRGMKVQLVSRRHADTIEGIRTLANARAAHWLWLDGMKLGSLSRLVTAASICRAAGLGVIIGGRVEESAAAARAACHVALACQADLLLSRPGQGSGIGFALLNEEMARVRQSIS